MGKHGISQGWTLVYSSSFVLNEAKEDGGAIDCTGAQVIIENSRSISNYAKSGKGGFAFLSVFTRNKGSQNRK